jgi:hypothetical protein
MKPFFVIDLIFGLINSAPLMLLARERFLLPAPVFQWHATKGVDFEIEF